MIVTFQIPIFDSDGNTIGTDEKKLSAIRAQTHSKIFIDANGNQNQSNAVFYFPPFIEIEKHWKVSYQDKTYPILELYFAPDANENIDHIQVVI